MAYDSNKCGNDHTGDPSSGLNPENAAEGKLKLFKMWGGGGYLVSTNTIIVYNLLT